MTEGSGMDVPHRGAWERIGISRDGGPLRREEPAVWLQVERYYADSRGFAGTTEYDGAAVRFHHEVGAPGDDVGSLSMQAGHMLETGVNADGSTFFEVWRALPDGGDDGDDGGGGDVGVWRCAGTQTVRVGRHIVHVNDDGGVYQTI
jgi:hypothetical protein